VENYYPFLISIFTILSEAPKQASPFPKLNEMKELLKQLASYNSWANQKLTELILSLPEEKQLAEVPSSFTSIFKTLLHMWDAESMWWQRMKMNEHVVRPSETFNGAIRDVVNALALQSKQWEEWIGNASDLSLEHVFQYYTTKKEHIKMPVSIMLAHVFNHGTYHRGQLVNMLRQLGVEKIPQTDFSVYYRAKK
jgi:uncharacterized damage-inducible protein DinB